MQTTVDINFQRHQMCLCTWLLLNNNKCLEYISIINIQQRQAQEPDSNSSPDNIIISPYIDTIESAPERKTWFWLRLLKLSVWCILYNRDIIWLEQAWVSGNIIISTLVSQNICATGILTLTATAALIILQLCSSLQDMCLYKV